MIEGDGERQAGRQIDRDRHTQPMTTINRERVKWSYSRAG